MAICLICLIFNGLSRTGLGAEFEEAKDMAVDLTFGLGVGAMFLLGAALLLVGYYGKKTLGKKPAQWFMGFGVIAIICAALVYTGAAAIINPPTNEIVPSATYDVTCSEAENELSVDATAHTMTWAIDYNTTSNAFVSSTGVGAFNFSIARSDVLLTSAVAAVSLGSVPTIDVSGAADEYLIDQNADDSFNVLMQKTVDGISMTAYESINVLVEAGSSAYVTVTITLNGAAAHAMTTNDITGFSLNVAGEIWHCTVIADSIHA
jgi:hypothetical protein